MYIIYTTDHVDHAYPVAYRSYRSFRSFRSCTYRYETLRRICRHRVQIKTLTHADRTATTRQHELQADSRKKKTSDQSDP